MKYLLVVILFCGVLFAQPTDWGWGAHRYINKHAVDYLPAGMSFFQEHREYLRQHAIDPDTDPLPGNYHYIDIDYYPEFFNGTLPHDKDSLIALYSNYIVEDNGLVPWIIDEWTDSLTTLMATGQWDNVWQIAAELGHYVADAHQPLHLTLNYNGQLTGNYGIHSRYETELINPRLSQLPLPFSSSIYWPNVLDSVFQRIDEIYPFVALIMQADNYAAGQDPAYGTTYYNLMWQQLGQLTTESIHKAIISLASIWRTAWENAGSPLPLNSISEIIDPEKFQLTPAYPNPFNPSTQIEITMPVTENISLKIYNMLGAEVATLVSERLAAGTYTYSWNASGFASGVYYLRLQTKRGYVSMQKLVVLK